MKIRVWVETGTVGGRQDKVIEVDDGATHEQQEAAANEALWDLISSGWEVID